jgi:hypothetical protein
MLALCVVAWQEGIRRGVGGSYMDGASSKGELVV